jgi:hypothetical protein
MYRCGRLQLAIVVRVVVDRGGPYADLLATPIVSRTPFITSAVTMPARPWRARARGTRRRARARAYGSFGAY